MSDRLTSGLATSSELINVFWENGMLDHDIGEGVFDTEIDPGFLDILEKHLENSDRIKNMVSILKRGPISLFIKWHSYLPDLVSELLSFHTQGDKGYKYAMTEVVAPAVTKFAPDMMVFVVGQDSSAVSRSFISSFMEVENMVGWAGTVG